MATEIFPNMSLNPLYIGNKIALGWEDIFLSIAE